MLLLLTPYPWSILNSDYSLLQHLHPGLLATVTLFPLVAALIAYDYYPNWRLIFACLIAWAVIAVCFIITAYSAFIGFSPFADLAGSIVVLSFLWFLFVASLKWAFALKCGYGIHYVNELPSQIYGMLKSIYQRNPRQLVKIIVTILLALALGISVLSLLNYMWLPLKVDIKLHILAVLALFTVVLALRFVGVKHFISDESA